jgi:cytoskeletal protein RodZ
MTILRPLLPVFAAVLLGGLAHAGEFSLGSARLLAENSAQSSVDVTVNFTDHGHALRESAEGGDAPSHSASPAQHGTDDTVAPHASNASDPPATKSAESTSATADAPHGVSIAPSTAIKRPSYRWQSLVPGTIK